MPCSAIALVVTVLGACFVPPHHLDASAAPANLTLIWPPRQLPALQVHPIGEFMHAHSPHPAAAEQGPQTFWNTVRDHLSAIPEESETTPRTTRSRALGSTQMGSFPSGCTSVASGGGHSGEETAQTPPPTAARPAAGCAGPCTTATATTTTATAAATSTSSEDFECGSMGAHGLHAVEYHMLLMLNTLQKGMAGAGPGDVTAQVRAHGSGDRSHTAWARGPCAVSMILMNTWMKWD